MTRRFDGRVHHHITAKMLQQPDLDLWFDKQHKLLTKARFVVRADQGSKTMEILFGEYKMFDGLRYAVKTRIVLDGRLFAEDEVVQLKRPKEFPPDTFRLP